jgi:hypothetical protein
MTEFRRREFLKLLAASGIGSLLDSRGSAAALNSSSPDAYLPSSIVNEYTAYLPGEEAAFAAVPKVLSFHAAEAVEVIVSGRRVSAKVDDIVDGWRLLVIAPIDGKTTAVFEKHATYRGVIALINVEDGTTAAIPKWIGDLATIRPRQTAAPEKFQLRRASYHAPGPDVPGDYILNSSEDPRYENVAALGPEYIGWTLVANEQSGPERSLYLQADGTSRELNNKPPQAAWAPDELGPLFEPTEFFPNDNAQCWNYEEGYSKRTLLGGYLPVADIGVWNRQYQCGYEVIVLLPEGVDATPCARVRFMVPDDQVSPHMKIYRDEKGRAFIDRYINGDAASFFTNLAHLWKKWNTFYEEAMPVDIPDEWLLAAARAGLTLCRCSYRGLEPTYQTGEGAYTKIPESSHALFPVAHYEFIWAHQLWNQTASADVYFQHYLDKYVMSNGDFLYNTQDQVEAPLCTGLVLSNSARSYFYSGNLEALQKRLPVLRRMIGFVLDRYEYAKKTYPKDDPRYGLIWGSPEADLGNPKKDTPSDHPFYYQNAVGVWRGLTDHGNSLIAASAADPSLKQEGQNTLNVADEMRENIRRSLNTTLSRMSSEMKAAHITPFTPEDIHRNPTDLESYENHRFMQDWFLADWGDEQLDLGHLNHRKVAGMQLCGLHIDGNEMRTSNFMEHGTLSVRIRQQDYRPFLLTLYGLTCFASDSGNRYAPEDALIPGGFPGEGFKWWWSSVINSTLQPTMGLRWLLCYEENNRPVCHLQKAAPRHWFQAQKHISVQRCPTRFGSVSWRTEAISDNTFRAHLSFEQDFKGDIHLHIHPQHGGLIRHSSLGTVEDCYVVLNQELLRGKRTLTIEIT